MRSIAFSGRIDWLAGPASVIIRGFDGAKSTGRLRMEYCYSGPQMNATQYL